MVSMCKTTCNNENIINERTVDMLIFFSFFFLKKVYTRFRPIIFTFIFLMCISTSTSLTN